MSNARLIDRLNGLADAVELGSISVVEFRDALLGHTEAIDGIPYSMSKEAQMVWAQLSQAIDSGQVQNVDVHAVGNWLRDWSKRALGPT